MTVENFKSSVYDYANEIGVNIKEVHLRKMTTKWASCSTKGRLTFDPELLKKSKAVRNEAVVHELLHLRYPNHGRMFKLLLKRYLT